jgi:hypothetical protein
MPQFDLVLYLPIFILFSFLFFCLNIFMNIFILPFLWNIFYIRYMKKQYNIFLNTLSQIQILNLNNLNLKLNYLINNIFKNISNESNDSILYIYHFMMIIIIKFEQKNDTN